MSSNFLNNNLSRRDLLTGLGTFGAAALIPGTRSFAQTATTVPRRIIDVHHHIMPPFYIHEHRRDQMKVGPGINQIFEWTPQMSLERMDANGVATSILSISTPGTYFGRLEEDRRLTRQVNEYSAKLSRDYPGRFGFFAALSLPDVDGSLKEIEYAFDTLKADGVGLMTSYGELPLGEKQFAPVFDELNRRKAIVFIHRTVNSCCMNLRDGNDKEFIIDDLRAVNSLLTGGTLARCPDIRFIHAHGDKTIPWVAHHIGGGGGGGRGEGAEAARTGGNGARVGDEGPRAGNAAGATAAAAGRGGGRGNPPYAPQGVLHELQKIYVDTAGNSVDTMDDLREIGMLQTQVMFGTDHPYGAGGNDNAIAGNLRRLMTFKLSQAELNAIGRENALRLFPKYA